MSLGIDDPVTRDAYRSSNEYFRQLARQLADILEEPIKVKHFFFFFSNKIDFFFWIYNLGTLGNYIIIL